MAELTAIVLAAGRSRRMQSDVPKVLHDLLGLPVVAHVVRAARAAGAGRVVIVASPDHRDLIAAAFEGAADLEVVVQAEPLGTAHAVLAARPALDGVGGTALVLVGDAPCISPASLQALLAGHREKGAQLSVLSGRVPDPTGYGRIVRGPDGELTAIIEHKDAGPELRDRDEINSGTFALELPAAWDVLERIQPNAISGERYVTDAVELTRQGGRRAVAVLAAGPGDVLGINDRAQLAQAIAVLRERIVAQHMANGVTVVDPASTFIDVRAQIEPDARLEPFVVIGGPSVIRAGATVGPFAHVRGGSTVGAEARVGNFVEVVRTEVGAGARALHLAYLGDGVLGREVNVGAGTILANYDGERHHTSRVGDRASLGANTVLIGPADIGADARTGAGAVVKGSVPAGATVVGVPARRLRGGTS